MFDTTKEKELSAEFSPLAMLKTNRSLQQGSWTYPTFLVVLCAVYLFLYLGHPALPGNNPQFPLGWWGWFDQGEYLKAAKATANGDFSSPNYFYPPLYPLLGALFVGFVPMHAFTLVNISCFISFAYCFVRFASSRIGWLPAVAVFCFSFYPERKLRDVWIEPWTSTLVAAIYLFLFFDIDRHLSEKRFPSIWRSAIWGAVGGAVAATRPLDAVALCPLFLYVSKYIVGFRPSDRVSVTFGKRIRSVLAMILLGIAGIVFMAAFNLSVHGSIGGTYYSVASQTNGSHPTDLPEKAVSLLLDPEPLYNVKGEAVFSRVRWMALGVPTIIYMLIRGSVVIRLLALTILLQLGLYLPYTDLLPTGIWRYQNIHYFKWMIPLIAFGIIWAVIDCIRSARYRVYFSCLLIGTLFLCLRIDLEEISSPASVKAESTGKGTRIRLSYQVPVKIDKIDLPTLRGDSDVAYLDWSSRIRIDGKELRQVRDYRYLPASQGASLLFIRPITARVIEIEPDQLRFDQAPVQFRVLNYGYHLGVPAWLFPIT